MATEKSTAATAAEKRAAEQPATAPPAGRQADAPAEKATDEQSEIPPAGSPDLDRATDKRKAAREVAAGERANPLAEPAGGYAVAAPIPSPDQELSVAKHEDAEAAAGARGADPMIAALEAERAGYEARGLDDRVAEVDEQLALRRGEAPKGRRTARTSRTSTT